MTIIMMKILLIIVMKLNFNSQNTKNSSNSKGTGNSKHERDSKREKRTCNINVGILLLSTRLFFSQGGAVTRPKRSCRMHRRRRMPSRRRHTWRVKGWESGILDSQLGITHHLVGCLSFDSGLSLTALQGLRKRYVSALHDPPRAGVVDKYVSMSQ